MSRWKSIYTIGHKPLVEILQFMQNLKRYGVNCVVDIRIQPEIEGQYSAEELKPFLNANGIWYLSFAKEFGMLDKDDKRRDLPVYDKVIKNQTFLDGIERLERGVEKGYTIAVLGEEAAPTHCFRNVILGRYLDEHDWAVYHILTDGTALSQKVLTENIQKYKLAKHSRKGSAACLGFDGEAVAAGYLIQHGYRILDRNWNLHKGCELDIIAFKDNVLHAIEVKTRSKDDVAPEMAINHSKMRHLIEAFHEYRYKHFLLNIPCQIDSIAIVMRSPTDYTINMYEKLTYFTKKFY